MAADNAIIIGLIAANFTPKHRKKIIMYGVLAALVFRIIFALSATYLFEFAIIKIIGGALLVWIVHDLQQDLFGKKRKTKSPTKVSKEPSFMESMYKVIFADITLSFDNVIGVVAASRDNYGLMLFGLFLSVVLIGTIATYFADYILKNKWIGYVGLVVILIVAIQLIIGGLVDYDVLQINSGRDSDSQCPRAVARDRTRRVGLAEASPLQRDEGSPRKRLRSKLRERATASAQRKTALTWAAPRARLCFDVAIAHGRFDATKASPHERGPRWHRLDSRLGK